MYSYEEIRLHSFWKETVHVQNNRKEQSDPFRPKGQWSFEEILKLLFRLWNQEESPVSAHQIMHNYSLVQTENLMRSGQYHKRMRL